MKPIRVGMIRCDTHAAYFGPQFARCDPLKLRAPRRSEPAHSWMQGACFLYFHLDCYHPLRMTAPFVGGFKLAKVWDKDRQAAEILAETFLSPPKVCDEADQVSDDVDLVFINDCNGDGSDHLALARPGIEKRVATFIDKPLAYDVADAVRIVALAKKRSVPLLSLSILNRLPQARDFGRRLPEVGAVAFGVVNGGGRSMAGHIHAISLAQAVFGNGVESVEAMGEQELGFVHLNYGQRKDRPSSGVMLNCDAGPTWHGAFYVTASGGRGTILSGALGDFAYPDGSAAILRLIKKMVRTQASPVPYDDMIENIAVATAARKAQRAGRPVRLSEVWQRERKPAS